MGQKLSVPQLSLADVLGLVSFPVALPREAREKTLGIYRSNMVHIPDDKDTWTDSTALIYRSVFFEILLPNNEPEMMALRQPSSDAKRKRGENSGDIRFDQDFDTRNSAFNRTQRAIASEVYKDPTVLVQPDSEIVSVSCHHYRSIVAIAYKSGEVHIYETTPETMADAISKIQLSERQMGGSVHPSAHLKSHKLTHNYQEFIYKISWAPKSGRTLAVATNVGVFLWRTPHMGEEPSSQAFVASEFMNSKAGTVSILRINDQKPVTSMCWSPCGRFLATGSISDSRIVVWDTLTETNAVLADASKPTSMAWSPDGQYLFVGTKGSGQFIIDSCDWGTNKLKFLGDESVDAAWSHDSSFIVVASDCKLFFVKNEFKATQRGFGFSLVKEFSLYPTVFEFNTSNHIHSVNTVAQIGGVIRKIAWDEQSHRLAVSFYDTFSQTPDGSELLLVFSTSIKKQAIKLIGIIRGPNNVHESFQNLRSTEPYCQDFSFQPNFEGGSLLFMGWANGIANFCPMYHRRLTSTTV